MIGAGSAIKFASSQSNRPREQPDPARLATKGAGVAYGESGRSVPREN